MTAPSPATARAPWWVTALDILALVMLAVMLRSMFDGGFRIAITEDIRLSLRSWTRIAVWLAAILVLRHVLWRVIPWHTRVMSWAARAWRWEPFAAAWPAFAVSRLIVLISGYVAIHTIGFSGGRQPWRALRSDLLDMFARWDAGWYFGIASRGYEEHFNPERMNSTAFFPGLPMLMRATGEVLDVNLWIAGIIVVLVAFLWGLTYVYRLARLDLPDDQARASVMLLAFYPFAVCYSAILTEAVFLLAAAATFYHFRRLQLWRAALFGLLAGLLRPNGFLLCVPLAILAMLSFAEGRGWLPWRRAGTPMAWTSLLRQLAVAAVPVLGMLAYAAHLNALTGRPFAFVEAQQAWGRTTFGGLDTMAARWELIGTQGFAAYARSYTTEILEAIAAFFALGAVWPIMRRFGIAYGVFVAMAVLPPLISMGSISLGRYTAPLFPIFLWLGAAIPAERRPYWIAAFAAGQALCAALFFTWRAPY